MVKSNYLQLIGFFIFIILFYTILIYVDNLLNKRIPNSDFTKIETIVENRNKRIDLRFIILLSIYISFFTWLTMLFSSSNDSHIIIFDRINPENLPNTHPGHYRQLYYIILKKINKFLNYLFEINVETTFLYFNAVCFAFCAVLLSIILFEIGFKSFLVLSSIAGFFLSGTILFAYKGSTNIFGDPLQYLIIGLIIYFTLKDTHIPICFLFIFGTLIRETTIAVLCFSPSWRIEATPTRKQGYKTF